MNRRKYRRIQATIHCRQAGVDFFAPHIEPVDISFGGLRIYSDEEYAVGAFLRLDIFFPRAAPVTFTAEVMWIQASAEGAPARYDVGLAFVELTSDALKLLQPLLAAREEPALAPEPDVDPVPPPADSAVDIDLEEEPPISEPPLVASGPATVRQERNRRPKLGEIPVLVAGADHLRAARLTGRAGFVLSLIDGITTVESLLDLSGMPVEETLGILEDLHWRGIVELRPGTQES
jgi:hypothetical protein